MSRPHVIRVAIAGSALLGAALVDACALERREPGDAGGRPARVAPAHATAYATGHAVAGSRDAVVSRGGAARLTVLGVVTVARPGAYLTDAAGRALYVFEKDTGRSACTGACAEAWPPYPAPAAAGSELDPALLSAVRGPDGVAQAAYDGRPLYYYAGDVDAGDTNGQDVDEFGGCWYLVFPRAATHGARPAARRSVTASGDRY